MEPIPLRAEQSNTSIAYADRLILKLFRRLGEGLNPDLETGRFLTDLTNFPHIAPVAGSLEYRRGRTQESATLGIVQGYVPNQGDAGSFTLDSLANYFERALAYGEDADIPAESPLKLKDEELPAMAVETIGPYLESARLLGQRTAELHLALSSVPTVAAYAPEPFTDHYRRSLYQSMRNLTGQVFTLLRQRSGNLPPEVRPDAQKVLGLRGEIINDFQRLITQNPRAARIRCHGDYHLSQVLYTGSNFIIIDFEGEPASPISERRLKRCPLRDVAGML